jgi:hypothetical protein
VGTDFFVLVKLAHGTYRFMRAARFPDELEMFLEDHNLQVFVTSLDAMAPHLFHRIS